MTTHKLKVRVSVADILLYCKRRRLPPTVTDSCVTRRVCSQMVRDLAEVFIIAICRIYLSSRAFVQLGIFIWFRRSIIPS